ncbi:MAG TPA: PIN domain nuclease [Candidatus Acidoferrum sp.]|nr:PIN domain nuclease [Candidatus Acidoferrum sp.]
MVIVDTTVWVDYFRGIRNSETDWLDREAHLTRIGLTDLILCEVLQGVKSEREFALTRHELLKFELFQAGGLELAVAAAKNFRSLRENGRTVRKMIDCWIATFCLIGGHTLLHRDRDFDVFEQSLGLRVLHPMGS